jgi:exodeoxyribonuclease VII small subunit
MREHGEERGSAREPEGDEPSTAAAGGAVLGGLGGSGGPVGLGGPEGASAGDAGEAVSFRQAMGELESILERIEGEEIDIDQLAQELRRAAVLLDLCRGKIRKAEVEVTQIVQSLETAGNDEDRDRA